jgi:hypothetical protein
MIALSASLRSEHPRKFTSYRISTNVLFSTRGGIFAVAVPIHTSSTILAQSWSPMPFALLGVADCSMNTVTTGVRSARLARAAGPPACPHFQGAASFG